MMADLSELIARVEGATGADRDLNADLLKAFGWFVDSAGNAIDHEGRRAFTVPDLTASLDAALALAERVLPGWWPRVECFGEWWEAGVSNDDGRCPTPQTNCIATAPTPALALVLAVLRGKMASVAEGAGEGLRPFASDAQRKSEG